MLFQAVTDSNKGKGILKPRKERFDRLHLNNSLDEISRNDVDDGNYNTTATTTTGKFSGLRHAIDARSNEDAELLVGSQTTDPPIRFPKSLLLLLPISDRVEERDREEEEKIITSCDLTAQNVRKKNKVMDEMLNGKPALLQNSGVIGKFDTKYSADSKIGLTQVWNFNHLATIFGAATTTTLGDENNNNNVRNARSRKSQWKCMVCPSDKHKFIEYDKLKNISGSDYYIKEPETESLDCTFEEFVQCAHAWRKKSIYFENVISAKFSVTRANDESFPVFDSKLGPMAIKELQDLFDWKWFRSLLNLQRFGSILSVKLSAGCRDSLRPCRYELEETFIVQIHGRRRILLINPDQTFKEGMYPYPTAHPYDKFTMVDLDDVNYGQFPRFAGVRGMTCVVNPGDILYIPAGWWRHEQGLCSEHSALEITVAAGERIRSDSSLEVLVSRDLERRVGEIEGVKNIKHWLQIIANAKESDWVDLGTVRGYQRICMTQMVRDEIDLNLGFGKWSDFLKNMVEGRLEATPWLNINFREPLYLTDKSEHHGDDRNEIEKEFPEFFVQKLRLENWNVDHTPMTVFNPDHPDTIAPRK